MKDKVEAVLFAAGRFVDEDYLAKILGEDIRRIRKALSELKNDYDKRANETSLQIVQEDKSWKLHVQDKYLDIVSKLVSDKEIAKTVLETLAIVAWKNPITQAELIKYRGPAAYEHVAELIERGFLTKAPEGRSFKLAITDKFFDYFDVEGREDIRNLFKQTEEKAQAQQADVDKQKEAYEEQKTLAEAAAKALAEGNASPSTESLKRANSALASSEHSAKDVSSLIEEAAMELADDDEENEPAIEPEKPLTEGQKLAQEARAEVEEFGESVDKLKLEEAAAEKKTQHPHKKHEAKPVHHAKPTHHAAHKKK